MAQLLPNAEILVVTTPQIAAAEVAERAGAIALQTHQRLVGVVENMSWLELPDGARMEIFGAGGGAGGRRLADPDSSARRCRCWARSRWTPAVREAGDAGTPSSSPTRLTRGGGADAIADGLAVGRDSLVGKPLGLRPADLVP